MSHLWIEHGQGWGILPLGAGPVVLSGDRERPVAGADLRGPCAGALFPVSASGADWALLCDSGRVRVNGEPVLLGIRALSDRDEIVVKTGPRVFFSQERLAEIGPFPGSDPATYCPRCMQEIMKGQPAVRCPQCGLAYHENREAGLTCWSYAPCVCGCDSSAEATFRWCPDQY